MPPPPHLTDAVRSFLASGTLPLSRSISQVQTLLRTGEYNAADLADHMRTDPILTARVMAVANSTFFSQVPCDGIGEAVNRLGSTQLMRIFAQVLAQSAMVSALPAYGLSADQIWRRAVMTAVGAELAAARIQADTSAAYMIGLLHELGRLPINRQWAGGAALRFTGFETEYVDEERRRFRFDQAELGGELLRQLAFPESVHRVIGRQYRQPLEFLALSLYLGRLAKTVFCAGITPAHNLEVLEACGLGAKRELDAFLAEVSDEARRRVQGRGGVPAVA